MNTESPSLTGPDREFSQTPVPADPALTLRQRALAGSDNCLNCGTELKGPFCYYCGQPDRNFLRFFPVLVRDMMEDVLDLDSRFFRTLKPLLFKPGRLTRDYMAGRRFRYAPPMRVYIFSSILFFLLAAFLSSDAVLKSSDSLEGKVIHINPSSEQVRQQAEKALDGIPANLRDEVDVEAIADEINNGEREDGEFSTRDLQFNDQPWDRETNPVDIGWLPDWINDAINDEIEVSPKKAKQINENPNLIVDKLFDILPATMFLLLPMVALIFKFWYLFAKRYYIEHLIFSLHNHSFVFVSLTLILAASVAGNALAANGYAAPAAGLRWLVIATAVWIPLYLLFSLRVVYRQNWFLTLCKYGVIGISYVTLLVFATAGVGIASFVLL